jgi:hypothetical protein
MVRYFVGRETGVVYDREVGELLFENNPLKLGDLRVILGLFDGLEELIEDYKTKKFQINMLETEVIPFYSSLLKDLEEEKVTLELSWEDKHEGINLTELAGTLATKVDKTKDEQEICRYVDVREQISKLKEELETAKALVIFCKEKFGEISVEVGFNLETKLGLL